MPCTHVILNASISWKSKHDDISDVAQWKFANHQQAMLFTIQVFITFTTNLKESVIQKNWQIVYIPSQC